MTSVKKEHWQIQLCLPYNALEKKETMKGKKTHYWMYYGRDSKSEDYWKVKTLCLIISPKSRG